MLFSASRKVKGERGEEKRKADGSDLVIGTIGVGAEHRHTGHPRAGGAVRSVEPPILLVCDIIEALHVAAVAGGDEGVGRLFCLWGDCLRGHSGGATHAGRHARHSVAVEPRSPPRFPKDWRGTFRSAHVWGGDSVRLGGCRTGAAEAMGATTGDRDPSGESGG